MKALIDADLIWLDKNGYQRHGRDRYVHRTVAEKALGRPLKSSELVHHIDENKTNNHPSNLLICDNTYHKLIHARMDMIKDGYSPDTHNYCSYHKEYHTRDRFSFSKTHWTGLHNTCREATNEYRRGKDFDSKRWNWKRMLQQQYRRCSSDRISWVEAGRTCQ